MRLKTRWLRLLAVPLICSLTSVALAGFSPALNLMQAAYEQGQAMTLDISAELDNWAALSPDSLAAVQDALKGVSLQLQTQEKAGQGAGNVILAHDGAAAYQISESWDATRRLMALLPQGERYVSGPAQSPLSLLTNTQDAIPWENLLKVGLWQSVQGALHRIYALIDPFEKTAPGGISIKNVGTARTRLEYALTREEWTALWPQMVKLLNDALEPWLGQALPQAVAAMRFEDDGVFKRFMDTDGMDLGWQFTGKLSFGDGVTRRVTLFGGFSQGKGVYVSFKAPATVGRDDLALNVSAKLSAGESKRSLQADYVFASRRDGIRKSAKGLIKLESADVPQGERISGSIRLDSMQTPGQTASRRWTLKPELLFKDGSLSGTLSLVREQGSAVNLALALNLLLKPVEAILPPGDAGARDLRALTPDALRQEQDRFLQTLLEPLKSFLLQLPQRQRMQLLHDMGRVQRTQGDSVPPLPEAGLETYVVSDLSVEEENP